MSSWFNLDPNKLKQLATSTLINAQKQIDKVLDIKDGAPGSEQQPIVPNTYGTTGDDFFSTFLGNQKSSTTEIVKKEQEEEEEEEKTEPEPTKADVEETKVDNDTSFSNWTAWSDNAASQIISAESQSAGNPLEDERTSVIEPSDVQMSVSSLLDSVDLHQHPPSTASLAESSTITESSSSESANSLRPTYSVPSSESTVIEPIGDKSNDDVEIDHEQQSDSIHSFPSNKRDVIDSWMSTREADTTEDNLEQSASAPGDNETSLTSSSLLYSSSYPPNEFPTSSIIDDELTPSSVGTLVFTPEQPQTTLSTDDDDDDEHHPTEQSSSPTHTISSSNGHDNHSKDSSDDGKQTSCASSDIEVISSPSVTSGLALSTTDTYDKCRELRDARQQVREVVVRFPSHSTNLKYHHHPLPMDNIDKNSNSNFDTPSWSTSIDEAATEQNHYQHSNEENDDNSARPKYHTAEASQIGELKTRLEQREQDFKKLTTESNELHRTNQSLKQSLTELEQRTSRLTNEFQQTIENLSLKIEEQKYVTQERDTLRRQLDNLQKQLFESSTSSGNTMAVLREKEEQIQQLLEEGEKLSKSQLQHNNRIKQLRTKEKENDTLITSLNSRIEKLTAELDETKKTLQEKEENEKQFKDTIKKLEKSAVHYEKECVSLKSFYEDAEEQIRSTKVALENSYKEIAELNKTKAATESKVVEATLSAEIALREEIRMALDKERLLSRQEQEKLQLTIEELRHSMQRSEGEHNRKIESSKQDMNLLRQRLQEAEARNEELTQNISNATRPLLRQIENLQATYVSQINSLEKTERQLTDRLAEMQAQYATSVEHERVANETLLETNTKWKLAEAQLNTFRQDKIRLTSELDIVKMKLTNFEDAKLREKSQVESMQEAFTQQINSLIQEKRQLEMDAELERSKYESDLKKIQLVHDTLKEQHDLFTSQSLSRTSSNLESTLSQQRSRRSSGGHDTPTSFSFERSPFVPTPKPSVYEALRNTGAIAVLESLEAQLKEKEGEITLLQSEIADLERTRESMARELVNLSTENEKLYEKTKNYPTLQEKYQQLETRYDALLTMYGEKQEETDELRLDLADVKTLYRAQIDDLLKQTNQKR